MSEPGQHDAARPASQRSAFWRIVPRVVISLLIAGGFVWALQRGGLPLSPPAHSADHLKWWGVPAFATLTLLCMLLRAYRTVFLLRAIRPDVSALRVVAIGMVGYGAIFFAPLRLGEMVRPYLLTQDEGITFTGGLGVVAAERIIDGLVMVALTATGLALSVHVSPLPDHVGDLPIPVSLVPRALSSATAMFVLAFVGMTGLYAVRRGAVRAANGIFGVLSPRLGALCARSVERVAGAFAFLTSPRSAAPFVLSTVTSWVLNALANWALLVGVGLPASFAVACVTAGVVALGSLLPAGPGFFGSYQIATYTSLAMYFAPHDVVSLGAMFVFASYAGYVVLNLLMALAGFYLLGKVRAAAIAA